MQQQLKSSSRAGNGCLLLFGLVWTGFSLFWILGALKTGGGAMALCGLPFVAIGLAMLYGALQPWIVGVKLGTPEVTLSRSTLRVGDDFTFRFSQAVRKPVEITKVSVHLLFRGRAPAPTYLECQGVVPVADHAVELDAQTRRASLRFAQSTGTIAKTGTQPATRRTSRACAHDRRAT